MHSYKFNTVWSHLPVWAVCHVPSI